MGCYAPRLMNKFVHNFEKKNLIAVLGEFIRLHDVVCTLPLKLGQKNQIDSLVGLAFLCVIMMSFTAYIHVLRWKWPEVPVQHWIILRLKKQEVNVSNPKLAGYYAFCVSSPINVLKEHSIGFMIQSKGVLYSGQKKKMVFCSPFYLAFRCRFMKVFQSVLPFLI